MLFRSAHTLRFVYQNRAFELGLLITAASAGIFVLLVLICYRPRRKAEQLPLEELPIEPEHHRPIESEMPPLLPNETEPAREEEPFVLEELPHPQSEEEPPAQPENLSEKNEE